MHRVQVEETAAEDAEKTGELKAEYEKQRKLLKVNSKHLISKLKVLKLKSKVVYYN